MERSVGWLTLGVHDVDRSEVYVSTPVGLIEEGDVSAADGSSIKFERALGFGGATTDLVVSGAIPSVALTVRSIVYQIVHRNDGKRVMLRRQGNPDIEITGCSLKDIERHLDF